MDGAKAKIKWAIQHIAELDVAINDFLNPADRPKPYSIVHKRNPETGQIIYYLATQTSVPNEISMLAGDILQNLRTALDYAVYALAVANGHTPTSQTSFPIFDHALTSPDDYSIFCRKVCLAGSKTVDYILKTKPYKGGNDVLWRLHALNIRDKHRLLLVAGLAVSDINVGQHFRATREINGAVFGGWVPIQHPWILRNVGQEILVDPPDVKVNENIEFKFAITFDEPGVAEGEPMKVIVGQSLDWVTGIVYDLAKFMP